MVATQNLEMINSYVTGGKIIIVYKFAITPKLYLALKAVSVCSTIIPHTGMNSYSEISMRQWCPFRELYSKHPAPAHVVQMVDLEL